MSGALAAFLSAVIVVITIQVGIAAVSPLQLEEQVNNLLEAFKQTEKNAEEMEKKVGALSRQMMLQQLFIEERIRSEGQSGIKQIRNHLIGTKTYHARSHAGRSVAAIHDHSNNVRTVGMGEFVGVLNGVEFRTRHNDYRLYMPSTTSTEYGKYEDVPFPDVPPKVLSKPTVKEQVEEMVEWFKAWQAEDHSVRDYRKYFRPVLSYLEATWTKNTGDIDEPFESDRHFVDASSWFDLQEKIRFTSYTGRKDNLENFAYLPTTIMETVNDTNAVFAQWNYRIMCHPLKTDVPLSRLRMIDDIALRLTEKHTMKEQVKTRAARFQVNPEDKNTWRDRQWRFSFLDKLMSEIPGKDNYPAEIRDDAFGQLAYTLDPKKDGQVLNAGYYHRWYKVLEKGAMGIQTRSRGFSDPSIFMAMNTQGKVAGMDIDVCRGKGKKKVCNNFNQKWSYAIPMEIIYLTPLSKWNPYNLTYKGEFRSTEGGTVTANGRNGGKTKSKAFNGINSKLYYLTPSEFFAGTGQGADPADTTRGAVGVLDPSGEVRIVQESGVRIFFPNIPGVGVLRQRYPIMPVHGEGSSTWKKLEAVQDLLMDSKTHARLYREQLATSGDGGTTSPDVNTDTELRTGFNQVISDELSKHRHTITLDKDEVIRLKEDGLTVSKTTSQDSGHQHGVEIAWHQKRQKFYIYSCRTSDLVGRYKPKCRDHHPAFLMEIKT